MIEQSFQNKIPFPLPRDRDSLVRRWAAAHQDLFAGYDDDIEAIRSSHRITEATGDDLDEIGVQFGRIGRRRGRGDEEYRQLLMSIDSAFAGRGTPRGLRFAIGAGVRADPDDEVHIFEHFDDLAYSVVLTDWIGHRVSTVHELADLADPSGVSLRKPVNYDSPAVDVQYDATSAVGGTVVTSPDASVTFGADDSTTTVSRPGAGAGRFDGLDEFGEGEPLGDDYDEGDDTFGQASYSEFSYGGDGTTDDSGGTDGGDGSDGDGGDGGDSIDAIDSLSVASDETLDVSSPMIVRGSVTNAGEVVSREDVTSTQSDDESDGDLEQQKQNDTESDDDSDPD